MHVTRRWRKVIRCDLHVLIGLWGQRRLGLCGRPVRREGVSVTGRIRVLLAACIQDQDKREQQTRAWHQSPGRTVVRQAMTPHRQPSDFDDAQSARRTPQSPASNAPLFSQSAPGLTRVDKAAIFDDNASLRSDVRNVASTWIPVLWGRRWPSFGQSAALALVIATSAVTRRIPEVLRARSCGWAAAGSKTPD